MKVINIKDVKKQKLAAPLFTDEVVMQTAISEDEGAEMNAAYVHFPNKVRNRFHKHTHDQVLIVTEGVGFYETKKKRFILKKGDIAWSPKGEVHSHGALDKGKFTHITVTRAKTKLTQIEK
jgi:4-carboxymuconolactone decarboxylase